MGAFIRKSVNCPIMSAEKGNLSGLATTSALDVTVQKTGDKKTIVLVTSHKHSSRAARPGARLQTNGLKKEGKKGTAQITKAVVAGFYRPDLAALAQEKYARVKTSLKTKKPLALMKSRRAPKP